MTEEEDIFDCPIGEVFSIIAGQWKPEILWYLKDGPLRFNQLQRSINGVSQKMLTQQLRELQRDGLVKRTQYEQIPPRVEYESTDLALSLEPIFDILKEWIEDHRNSIHGAKKTYDKMKG